MGSKYLKISCLALTFISLHACVSRLARPELTGYVFDQKTGEPLADVIVGEAQTDIEGYYKLTEQRYWEVCFPLCLEAPPLYVNETVEKDGYLIQFIEFMQPYGGAGPKGTAESMEPIYLQKKE